MMATPTASTTNGGTSRRQWQRDQTAAEIERAALPVLLRLGFDGATAELLAEASGVSLRTLFRYYPSGKDDIILAGLRRSLSAFETALRARPADESLLEALTAARDEWFDQMEAAAPDAAGRERAVQLTLQIATDHPDLTARMLGERQMLAERVVDVFAARLGLDGATELQPRLAAHCFVAALITAYFAAMSTPGSDARALVEQAVAMIAPLLLHSPGN